MQADDFIIGIFIIFAVGMILKIALNTDFKDS